VKVLHTSDWHLGRVFHGASLLAEQQQALARVVDVAADAGVDVVVVSGDLYDRAIPPADAVDLLADVLGALRATGAQVVAITGNHDSPNRVGAFDALLRAGGVTLRGRFDPSAPVVVPATDGGPDLVVHPVPYLEPLAAARGDDGARPTQHRVVADALDAVRADLAARGPARSVVVAHAFVAGAAPSDSERELTVGGVDRVPESVFDGITYAALGHLHRAQELSARVAYSGSILPYSFSETGSPSVRVVDLRPDGSVASEVVDLGAGRGVATVRGRLDDLLTDPSHTAAEGRWVRVQLTDEVVPRLAMDRLRDRFPHAVVLEHDSPRSAGTDDDLRRRAAGEPVAPVDLARAFLADRLGRPVDAAEAGHLHDAFDAVEAARRELGDVVVDVAADPSVEEAPPSGADGPADGDDVGAVA